MLHSTVTSKGQTTIPETIERLCESSRATDWSTRWRETELPFVCTSAFDHSKAPWPVTKERVSFEKSARRC
jgi:hypothetical protein